ncbi:MAG TPA: caspase family protein [Burkholderiaceae bacterium]|nr:caspase family protein [Burkholderiaceae bacterium]HMY98739.1 caspase family protein [Burkholderiaceae bacterium]HNB42976.1 caspase family protein [Burkholderiaceae bacterium]HNG79219.1 caspase family protein [Burkholderiaceae bacterium]
MLALLSLGGVSLPSQAAEPSTAPQPRIEAGMHTALIRRIATDAQGRWAVTASDDKSARLWDLASGNQLAVIRPPQDLGHEGKVRAVTMSGDGKYIALGGHTGLDWGGSASVYVYYHDTKEHRVTWKSRIGELPDSIYGVAFSAGKGLWLAVCMRGANGLRIFDSDTGRLTGEDRDYGGTCNSVEFSSKRDSEYPLRLLTTSEDGNIRTYNIGSFGQILGGKPFVTGKVNGGERPYAARFSPNGKQVAVGFSDSPAIQVIDPDTLHEIFRPDIHGVANGNYYGLAWSRDGRRLAAAGRWQINKKIPLRIWSANDGRKLADLLVATNTVMDLVSLPEGSPGASNGGWLFVAEHPAIGLVDGRDNVIRIQDSIQAEFREQIHELKLSDDGREVVFGFEMFGKSPVTFDLADLQFHDFLPSTKFNGPRTDFPGLEEKDWRNAWMPRLNGQVLDSEDLETSRSLVVDAKADYFALGTDWWLRYFDRSGRLLWKSAAPGNTWAVNLSRNGRWVVAAYGDGTIRWHRVSDGQEVLAFFPHADRQRWVLWTPEGFYAASESRNGVGGGAELLGYHINRGRNRMGEFVTAAQLSETFHNPALVSKRLSADGDVLMAEAVKTIGSVDDLLARAQSLPPALKVALPPGGRLEGDTEVTVEMTLEDRGGGIGPVRLFVDGYLVEGRQGASSEGVTVKRSYTLRLAPGARNIELQPTSLRGVAGNRSAPIPALLRAAQPGSTLHILAVGVQAYQDKSLNPLAHSVNDARDVAAEIARRAQPLFKTALPDPIVLTEQQATREGIDAAFEQLKARMKPEDTLVIFLAGHGQARIGTYTYLPWDYQPGATGKRGEGLNEKRLFEMLQQSPARTLLLIDTCDAGGMVDMLAGAYQRMSKERQRPVIGAARKGEFAREGYKGHGVFSAALLDVLGADGRGKSLSVVQLHSELAETVDEFSKKMPGNYFQTVTGLTDNGAFPVVRR